MPGGRFEPYVLVAAGGFCGACARYLINVAVPSWPGIMLINIAGCFLLGFIMYASAFGGAFGQRARVACGAGFVGAFTTFSTFSLQTFQAPGSVALFNMGASLTMGLLAVLAGRQLAVLISEAR